MNALIEALRQRGLVAADVAPPAEDPERPWFISLLMGLAGWVAGIFVLLFLTLALDIQSPKDVLVPAVILLGVAWVLYLVGRGRVFVDQLALALSIAGQTPRFGAWTLPLAWLISWLPPTALALALRLTETRWMARAAAHLARPAITGLLLGIALCGMSAEPLSTLAFDSNVTGQQFDVWAVFPLLSIALALFAAWNAFALRNAGLLGLAVFAAFVHLSRFYYVYGTTLSIKSAIMLVAGLLSLGVSWLLARRMERSA